jgi:hypothetical protein
MKKAAAPGLPIAKTEHVSAKSSAFVLGKNTNESTVIRVLGNIGPD